MEFNNRVTQLLGVETPIVQAPMGWIAPVPAGLGGIERRWPGHYRDVLGGAGCDS